MKTPKQWAYRMLNTISHDEAMKRFENLNSFVEAGWGFKTFVEDDPTANELEFKTAFRAGALDWLDGLNKA